MVVNKWPESNQNASTTSSSRGYCAYKCVTNIVCVCLCVCETGQLQWMYAGAALKATGWWRPEAWPAFFRFSQKENTSNPQSSFCLFPMLSNVTNSDFFKFFLSFALDKW